MKSNHKIVSAGISFLTIFIFICLIIRIGITLYENYDLVNSFVFNPDSSEPYQQQMHMAEEDFIDFYIDRFYSIIAVNPVGRSNVFVLEQPIRYYSAPDDHLTPVLTLESGKKYIITTNNRDSFKNGTRSWPTYQMGWRFVTPFVEEGEEESIENTPAYYVKLKDLFDPLKSIIKELHYRIPKGYNYRRMLLVHDEKLYDEGSYLSPDLNKPVMDGWNITLLMSVLSLIIIKIILHYLSVLIVKTHN